MIQHDNIRSWTLLQGASRKGLRSSDNVEGQQAVGCSVCRSSSCADSRLFGSTSRSTSCAIVGPDRPMPRGSGRGQRCYWSCPHAVPMLSPCYQGSSVAPPQWNGITSVPLRSQWGHWIVSFWAGPVCMHVCMYVPAKTIFWKKQVKFTLLHHKPWTVGLFRRGFNLG